jgi:hypothetical protein
MQEGSSGGATASGGGPSDGGQSADDGSGAIGDSSVRSAVVEAARQAGYGDGSKDGQSYLNRDDVPYDPAEGLLSGTAITGETEIPGDHENTDAVDDGEGAPADTDQQLSEDSRAAETARASESGDAQASAGPATESADLAAGSEIAHEQSIDGRQDAPKPG